MAVVCVWVLTKHIGPALWMYSYGTESLSMHTDELSPVNRYHERILSDSTMMWMPLYLQYVYVCDTNVCILYWPSNRSWFQRLTGRINPDQKEYISINKCILYDFCFCKAGSDPEQHQPLIKADSWSWLGSPPFELQLIIGA